MENPMRLNEVITIISLLTGFGNLCIMVYTLSRFLAKPNVTQNERLTEHDERIRELNNRVDRVNERLDNGSTHFHAIDETNALIQKSLLVIISSLEAIMPNDTEKNELRNAKNELFEYLSNK